MDGETKQLFDYEGFGLAVAEYFMLKWNIDSSQYYSRIDPEKIDVPDFHLATIFDDYQIDYLVSKIEENKRLAEEVDGSYIEEIDKALDDFFKQEPSALQCKYFGCTATVELMEIMARSSRSDLDDIETYKAFKEDARNALPEDIVEKINSSVLPISQRLVKSLNDNYRKLFDDVENDDEIPDQIYRKLGRRLRPHVAAG